MKIKKDDREYTVDHIVRNSGKGANSAYVIMWYGYSAAYNTIKLSTNRTTNFIKRNLQKHTNENRQATNRTSLRQPTQWKKK